MEPLDFIEALRKTDKHIEMIYMNGGCYQFYKVLKVLFPEAKPYINSEKNYIATKIGNGLYDITGYAKGIFYPLDDEKDIEMCKQWGFAKDYYLYKVCPHCDEQMPITSRYEGNSQTMKVFNPKTIKWESSPLDCQTTIASHYENNI